MISPAALSRPSSQREINVFISPAVQKLKLLFRDDLPSAALVFVTCVVRIRDVYDM